MEALGFVFDLDDTLYAERDYVQSCFRLIGPRLGGSDVAEELWRLFESGEGNPIGEIARRNGIPEDTKEILIAEMRGHTPRIALDRGAELLIERLRAMSRRFSIVTNGRSVTQRRKIEALEIADAAGIIISEEYGAAKPDVSLFHAAAAAQPASRYIYVGDNPALDFEGPNSLGWMTVMLRRDNAVRRRGFAPSQVQRPQRIIDSLEELVALI